MGYRPRDVASAVFCSLIWAIMVILRKWALNSLDVFTMLVLSRFVTVLLLGGALVATGRELRIRAKGVWPYLVLLGSLNLVLNWLGAQGMQWTTATNSAVLFRTDILFTVVLGWAVLGEKVQRIQVPMMVAAVVGCLMVIWPGAATKSSTAARPLAGNVFCVLCGLVLTVNAIIIKAKLSGFGKLRLAFWNSLLGLGYFVGAWFAGSDVPSELALVGHSPKLIWILLGAGVAAAVVFMSYYQAIWNLPVWVVRVLLLTSPAFAVVMAKMLWAEQALPMQWVGMLLLIGGTASVVVTGRRPGTRGVAKR